MLQLRYLLAILILGGIASAATCGGATTCYCGDSVNESYTFAGDLQNSTGGTVCPGKGLVIAASDITVDCAGYDMNGTTAIGTGYRALEIEIRSNATIRNCDINGFGANFNEGSIYVYLSDNITLDNIDFNMPLNTNVYAVHLFRSSDSIINNSRINASASSGGAKALTIYEDGANQADDNVIENTLLHSQSGQALYIQNGDHNSIKDCNLSSATQDAVYFNGPANYNIISGSRIVALYTAMTIWGAANNTIEDSYLKTANNANLLYIFGSPDTRLIGNVMDHTFTGGISRIILLDNNANGVLIQGNNLTNSLPSYSEVSGPLIYVASGSGYDITGNRFMNPYQNKIYMASGAGGGTISDNWFGPADSAAAASALRFVTPSVNRTFILSGNTFVGPKLDIDPGNELLMSDTTFMASDGTSAVSFDSIAFNGSASFRLNGSNLYLQDNITAVYPADAALDMAFNSTAHVTNFNVSCSDFSINYNGSFITNPATMHGSSAVADERYNGLDCYGGVCTDVACTGTTLTYTVPSWSSFMPSNATAPSPPPPAEFYSAAVSNVSVHGRFGGIAMNVTTEGGNITSVTANATQLTERWAAFYGNVTGGILLRGATSPNNVYSWSWSPAEGGVICVSTNSSISQFYTLPATGPEIDNAWSLSAAATDSGTSTFNSTSCSLDIGAVTVANTSYADTGAAGGFVTCAIKSTPLPAKDQMMFCSDVISGGTAWNGVSVDYEVMVPTPSAPGSSETYYFYANLN